MKRFLVFLTFTLALFGLWACSADYDTFGTSDYKNFNSIQFENQDGDVSVYEDEHKIVVTMLALPDSVKSLDSVVIVDVDVSSMATLHLVDGKFKEFPSDSAALDSLAHEVSYTKAKLQDGDKIRIPASLVVYLMVVSESGIPSIWQVTFKVPGVEAPSSSSSAEDSDDVESSSSDGGEVSSSSEETPVESSSSVALSDNNDLKITFKDELENAVSGDTIYVTFARGTDLTKVAVDEAVYHRAAAISVKPSEVTDWSKAQKFVVTAENGDEKTWIVVAQTVLNNATDLQIVFKNQLKANRNGDTVAIKLQSDQQLASATLDSFKLSEGATVSPKLDSVKTWTASQTFEVTAENGTKQKWVVTLEIAEPDEVASDEKELISISAEDQIKAADVDAAAKTVLLHLASQEAKAAVTLKVAISETASQNLPLAAVDLRNPVVMTITAEDGSSVDWTISADYPLSAEADIKSFTLDGTAAEAAPVINAAEHSVSFEVAYGTDLSKVYFVATYSDKAKKKSPSEDALDLTSGSAKILVVAENGDEVEWTVKVKVGEAPVIAAAPRIHSLKIAGKDAVVDSVKENGKWVYWAHYDNLEFRSDLTALKVSDIQLSDGAEITGVTEGSSYDLGTGVKATVSNGSESVDYLIHAGYQLPGSDFNTWKSSGVMSPDSIWGNANMVGETTSKFTSGSMIGAQIKTNSILGKIASGSLYTAEFNPKGVGTLAMANSSTWPDGNELLDFGKKFNARPSYLDVKFSYAGSGDSCDIYLVLENRTGDLNRNRSTSDVNKLVASAWYRSTTADNTGRKNPDVISISEEDASGMRTMRLKLHYGTPLAGSPIENSSVFNTKLASKDTKAIDNSVVQGTGDEPVTHIRLVFASSADGNHYKGKSGATLKVDEIRLVY